MPETLLASGSPRRRELLRLMGMPFEVVIPDTHEDAPPASDVAAQVSVLAQRKALAAARHGSADLVIAADTLVLLGNQVMGKPPHAESAREMLEALRGREHRVVTGLVVLHRKSAVAEVQAVETRVWMRDYGNEEVAGYIARGEPFDKAGAYAIQDVYFHPVERIEGCYANVMGLPLCHLFAALDRLGCRLRRPPLKACQAYIGRKCNMAEQILSASTH